MPASPRLLPVIARLMNWMILAMAQQSLGSNTHAESSVWTPPTIALVREPLRIRLLGRPPSWNAAYRAHGSIVYKTRIAKEWKTLIESLVRARALETDWSAKEERTIVDISISLKRPMDADNILKLTLDAVASGLGINDRWFLPRVWSLQTQQDTEYVDLSIWQEGDIG